MKLPITLVVPLAISLNVFLLAACTSGMDAYSVTIDTPASASSRAATGASIPVLPAASKALTVRSTVSSTAPLTAPTSEAPVASSLPSAAALALSAPAPSPAIATVPVTNAVAATIVTKHASYAVVPFSSLPGWDEGDPRGSLTAFVRGCSVLDKRAAWREACQAGKQVDANDEHAVRDFYQHYFTAYHIEDRDRNPQGILTGYYEPTLDGRAVRSAAFPYPVYGMPSDLLFMDSRLLPSLASAQRVAAHVEGRNVIPVEVVSTTDTHTLYVLDLRGGTIDIRDKKLRLRIDGNRIVPYFSRADIERNGLKAPVLAYVANPEALYAMQIQGNGQIRMGNGDVIRLSYAEQNSRPFTPRQAVVGDAGPTVRVRGITIATGPLSAADATSQQLAQVAGDVAATETGPAPTAAKSTLLADIDDDMDDNQWQSPSGETKTRGFVLSNPLAPVAAPTSGAGIAAELVAATPSTPAVNSWLALSAPAHAPRTGRIHGELASVGASASANTNTHRPSQSNRPLHSGQTVPDGAFENTDPNYVFFRESIARQGGTSLSGPIGTLGVALSAGQSVAVDPRTTPLGAPVFLSDALNGAGRLMVAQDSGSAVQGAVRADYFYGSGAGAQNEANKTQRPVEMWVLLPKDMNLAAGSKLAVRGEPVAPSDCLVQDELCKDD